MNEEQKAEILIRLDERMETVHDWMSKHDEQHKSERATRIRWLLPVYSAIVGVVVKMIFWR